VPAERQQLFFHGRELLPADDARTLLDMNMHTGFALKGYDLVGWRWGGWDGSVWICCSLPGLLARDPRGALPRPARRPRSPCTGPLSRPRPTAPAWSSNAELWRPGAGRPPADCVPRRGPGSAECMPR
jgi:hypothetical protein